MSGWPGRGGRLLRAGIFLGRGVGLSSNAGLGTSSKDIDCGLLKNLASPCKYKRRAGASTGQEEVGVKVLCGRLVPHRLWWCMLREWPEGWSQYRGHVGGA